jgi:hypothetical protein
MAQTQPNYALQSIAAAYGLALAPCYYTVLRMMAATGGKWSFAMCVFLALPIYFSPRFRPPKWKD